MNEEEKQANPIEKDATHLDNPVQGLVLNGVMLVQTCSACPEQYDAYIGDERVAYLRLRHGIFRVECPDVGGDLVLHGAPDGDGSFTNYERHHWLSVATDLIQVWHSLKNGTQA